MNSSFIQVGIIGAGELGHALGNALTKAHVQVLFYDRDPAKSTTGSIEDLVRSCGLLLVCVPSWAVKEVAKQIRKAAHPQQERAVITFAKGVEPGFVTMDKILHDHVPENYVTGVMYGPMIAGEIDRGRPAHGIVALSNSQLYSALRDQFADANMYIEISGDMRGVTLCAVLKNVYAIGFGVVDGLHLGLNSKGKLAVMVLTEMKRLLAEFNADPQTAESIAGLGDLLATGFSEESFNYRVGKSLAERIADEHIKSEGIVSLHELGKYMSLKNYPVASAIENIVFHYAQPQSLGELLTS